jgi:hypothetical protein
VQVSRAPASRMPLPAKPPLSNRSMYSSPQEAP